MCGRFDLHSETKVILREFRVDSFSTDYHPSYNIAPSRRIVIIKDDGKKHIVQCMWGFLPSWVKDPSMANKMINARAETVAEKPAFKDSFRHRRCLVVADGFFEWRRQGKRKMPVYVRLKSRSPIGFAGIYNTWTSPEGESICTCAIITTEANDLLEPIHDRMPAIIPKDGEDLWLDPHITEKERLMPLLRPYASEDMEMYDVSPLVNKPGYDSPEIIIPDKG
ncbi:MAG: SOS response-associated peptidase [Nitrospirae bacterium]|nr:SOS response-associated peptidase [Nitrospirota bacterium]